MIVLPFSCQLPPTDVSPPGSVVVLSITTVTVISITSLLLFSTCGFLVGMMVQRAINKYKGKSRLDSTAVLADYPLPTSVTHTSELTPVYEDILPPEKQKKIELQENIAYGPVSQPRT